MGFMLSNRRDILTEISTQFLHKISELESNIISHFKKDAFAQSKLLESKTYVPLMTSE
jgi:hypothetical protein